jgi:hypothetical protein
MSLNQYAAEHRLAIFEELRGGREPSQGRFDAAIFKEARSKGAPQMGTTRYAPDAIVFEFIYPDPLSTAMILTVSIQPPERIVFLPVPSWVVENIWQGDIAGTYHFESDAQRLVEDLRSELAPEANLKWFGPQPAKRRE